MKKERIALITEAGNNLGIRFASILHEAGYKVILAAKQGNISQLKKAIVEDIHFVSVDFTHSAGLIELKNKLTSSYGKLDVLINNAEIANGFGQKIHELNIEELKTLYQQNLFSIIELSQLLYPLLAQSEKASIINISSGLGKIEKMQDDSFCYAQYQMTGYATAKAALEMFTVTLNREFKASNIEVFSFDPVRPKNSRHNALIICKEVQEELLGLLDKVAYPPP
ncbi:MAG: SDR family NAD(P)-dependent oxidoreductase [Bacteroidota bacterium]